MELPQQLGIHKQFQLLNCAISAELCSSLPFAVVAPTPCGNGYVCARIRLRVVRTALIRLFLRKEAKCAPGLWIAPTTPFCKYGERRIHWVATKTAGNIKNGVVGVENDPNEEILVEDTFLGIGVAHHLDHVW